MAPAQPVRQDDASATEPTGDGEPAAQSLASERPQNRSRRAVRAPPGPPPQGPRPPPGPIDSPVTILKGVSTVNQKRLARLGIETVHDLLYHLPRRYDDFAELKTINRLQLGDEITIVGVVKSVRTQRNAQRPSVDPW